MSKAAILVVDDDDNNCFTLVQRLRARPETRSGQVQVPYRADRRPDFRCATGTLSPPRDPFDITRPAPSVAGR